MQGKDIILSFTIFIVRIKKGFSLPFIVLFLSSCALGTDYVKLHDPLTYKPANEEGTKVAYADIPGIKPVTDGKIKMAIKKVKDNRPDTSCIGTKRNTFGMATGKVDVEEGTIFLDLFKKHLINTFNLAGYEIIPIESSDIISTIEKENVRAFVGADIKAFWADFVPGAFVVDAESDVIFEIKLSEPSTNQEVWGETFKGHGKVSGIAVTRGMYEESLNIAYAEAMKNFYRAISDEKVRNIFLK